MPDDLIAPVPPSADDETVRAAASGLGGDALAPDVSAPRSGQSAGRGAPRQTSASRVDDRAAMLLSLAADAAMLETADAVIGRYHLLRELGKGGFGMVWHAEQTEPIQREVALKIIKPGMDSSEIIARFEAERQALAMMDHPNIAAVLDAGTTGQGRPYFVMELVKGVAITEYCDAHRLGIRERVELFIPVCQAVQHAHQKSILHRDLKPSNILVTEVDGRPVPKIIDFGIAKALGVSQTELADASEALTREGMVVGTPQYMSPEQAGSMPDVDTRSDVYTLGVILHELLTGQTPLSREQLRTAAFDEVLRLVREGEVRRPSSRLTPRTDAVERCASGRNTDPKKLSASLRGDLDWIVLKALEKERERRYETANALARDLRRSLDFEPVSAGPPSARYRLRKMMRRHRLAFFSALGILIVLAAGVVTSTWQAVRARAAERLARVQLDHAEKARDAAENLVADAIFGLRDKLIPIGKISVLDGMQKAAEDYYSNLPPSLATDTTRHHQVKLAINRGYIAGARSDDDAAEEAALRALGMARQLAAAHPGDLRFLDDETTAVSMLALLRGEQGAAEEARAYGDEAFRLADRWSERDPKSLQPLLIKLAVTGERIIAIGDQGGNLMAALAEFSTFQKISDQLKALGGESIETATVDALAKLGRAVLVSKTGSRPLTTAAYREVDDAFLQAMTTFGPHPFTRQMMLVARSCAIRDLRAIADQTGDADLKGELEQRRLDLVREREKLVEAEPLRLDWWRELAGSYSVLIAGAQERGDLAMEFAWSEKAFAAGEKAASPHCDRRSIRNMRLGNHLALVNCLRKVKPDGWAERALKLIVEAEDIDLAPLKHGQHEIRFYVHRELGRHWWEIVMELDRPERAAETLRQFQALIAAARRVVAAAPDQAQGLLDGAEAAGKIAEYLQQRGRANEAAPFGQQRDQWKEELLRRFPDDPSVLHDQMSTVSDNVLKLYAACRKASPEQKSATFGALEAGVRAARALLEEKRASLPDYDDARLRGEFAFFLGGGLVEAQRFPEAEAALRTSIEAHQEAAAKAKGADAVAQTRWEATDPLLKLGVAIFKQGRAEEGRKLAREAAEAREALARERPTAGKWRDSGNAWRDFAGLLDTSELADERIAALENAIRGVREGLRLAEANAGGSEIDLSSCRTSLGWALLDLGSRQRDRKHLAESENALRDALAVSLAHVAAANPPAPLDRTLQLLNIRWNLASTLLGLGRPAEARDQADAIAAGIRVFEDPAGRPMPELDQARRLLAELSKRLGDSPAK